MAKKKKAAKKKTAKKTAKKKGARKSKKTAAKSTAVGSKVLPKRPKGKYTKSQLVSHLAEATSAHGHGEVSKKQAAAFLEELSATLINYSPYGATLPGIGKLVLKKTPRRPARMGRNPATGEPIKIAAKPAGKKLAFRVAKAAKVAAGI